MLSRIAVLVCLALATCTSDPGTQPPEMTSSGPSTSGTGATGSSGSIQTNTGETTNDGSTASGALPDDCIVFVSTRDGNDDNAGFTWETAKRSLSASLETAAQDGCAVWIAEGDYHPTDGADRTASFELFPGARLYGGFIGGESSLDERDLDAARARLSGDIGAPNDTEDNSHHVLIGADGASVDGLIIEFGNSAGGPEGTREGAGLRLSGGNMTISNSVFRRNQAAGSGGSIYAFASESLAIENCVFEDNLAGDGMSETPIGPTGGGGGGAVCFDQGGTLSIASSTFNQNQAGNGAAGRGLAGPGGNGGAIHFIGEMLQVAESDFQGNRAGDGATAAQGGTGGSGGAIAVILGGARIERSSFSNNTAGDGGPGSQNGGGGDGGALALSEPSSFIVVGSRFEQNAAGMAASSRGIAGAPGTGGAISVRRATGGEAVVSSIFVGNSVANPEQSGAAGGAVMIYGYDRSGEEPVLIANSAFANNEANAGGAVAVESSGTLGLRAVNNSFGGNAALATGGAVLYSAASGTNPESTIVNSVFWENSAPEFAELGVTADAVVARPVVEVSYTSIEGGCPASTLVDCDVSTESIAPGYANVMDGDLRPLGGAVVDRGDDARLPPDTADVDTDGDEVEPLPLDLDGGPRVGGSAVDLGAYETSL